MIIKVPQREPRKFNYQPRYYTPVKPDANSGEGEEDERTAMRNRIREGMERQKKHERLPATRLMVFVLLLFVLLWILSML
ncbi:MAG: hypothetical protein J5873_06760 [Bacteroidales bacterium]|nr:hypothetical protein [Bacteroidales bacterium]